MVTARPQKTKVNYSDSQGEKKIIKKSYCCVILVAIFHT